MADHRLVTTHTSRSGDGTWLHQFANALDVLSTSERGHVIVELAGTPYYLQLLLDDNPRNRGGVLGEAVSNEYLEGPERLSVNQERALEVLGWRPPHASCDPLEDCAMQHPNWFRFGSLTSPANVRSSNE